MTGVITEQLVSLEVAHHGLSTLDTTPTMHDRKARMAELADGVIVLPGGFGTWEEHLVDQAVKAGFVSEANAGFVQRADTAAEVVRLASGPAPGHEPKWVD